MRQLVSPSASAAPPAYCASTSESSLHRISNAPKRSLEFDCLGIFAITFNPIGLPLHLVTTRSKGASSRLAASRRFQEKELWSILASCIVGLSHLQKSNLKHGCLRSSSILISPDGIIKVYDPIATGSPSNYDTLLSHRDTPHIYLSPEQVEALKEEKVQHDYDPFRSDIFTMGMVVL